MVILQFNRLIRNKWIWGVFAFIVGGAFAFDFLVDDLLRDDKTESRSEGAGTLGGQVVDANLFGAVVDDIRGLGDNRDWQRKSSEVNREAWEMCAILESADRNGIYATDSEVARAIKSDRSFQQNGQFSFALYQALLRSRSLVPERFEEYLKRRITMSKVVGTGVVGSSVWASPMEVEQAVNDMTDVFTVKVARFTQDKKDADAVKLDDDGLKKWYDDNAKSLELPERVKLRMLKFNAADTNVLARMSVTEDDLRDHYDVTVDKYTSTDTNGVEVVKKFDEVKDLVEKEVRQIAAVQFFETNANNRAYAVVAAKGKSRLDEIAAEDGLKVETSDWLSSDGTYKVGFMTRYDLVFPGVAEPAKVVAELDKDNDDLRYGILSSDKFVWLVEKVEISPAHVPTFEEAKEIVRPRALAAAKADAFKAAVEAVVKKGAQAVLEAGNVSTNLVFSICDLKHGDFPDQTAIVEAAKKLRKGEVSDFVRTTNGRGLVVICEDRVEGDAAKAQIYRMQVRGDIESKQSAELYTSWPKWNLERLGFETGDGTSIAEAEEE